MDGTFSSMILALVKNGFWITIPFIMGYFALIA
jgi:hypothetical protein